MIIALIPAHNEQGVIGSAVRGLRSQTVPPDQITVVMDRCDDNTGRVALASGADTLYPTRANYHKKAGAINQYLSDLLPTLDDNDVVLIQDADTILDPGFVEAAIANLSEFTGAVGGVFYGESGRGLIGQLQRSEFVRYARQIERDDSQVRVLSGTASVFLVSTLRAVWRARQEGSLPASTGIYDVNALTEDNEISLALKTLGYRPISPPECRVTTEVMPTWHKLWRQRVRWQRGALENLRAYGWTRATRPYIVRQVLALMGACALALYFIYLPLALAVGASMRPGILGIAVLSVFIAERIITVRRGGWRAIALALPIVIELAYDTFLTVVYASSVAGWLRRSATHW